MVEKNVESFQVPFLDAVIVPVREISISGVSDRKSHSSLVARYATLKFKMTVKKSIFEQEYRTKRAQLDKITRSSFESQGEKYTEARIAARMEMDKGLQALKKDLDLTTAWIEFLGNLFESLRHRKDMLMSLAADTREEYNQS